MSENVTFPKKTELSFQFAQDTAKHLVTLATVTIAFTVTFSKDFLKDISPGSAPKAAYLVVLAWISLLFSVLFGQACLMALTGRLTSNKKCEIYHYSVRVPAFLQVAFFVVGFAAVVIFAIKNVPK